MKSFVPTSGESITGLESVELRPILLNVFCTVRDILSSVSLNYLPGRERLRFWYLKGNVFDIFKCFVVYN